MMKIRLTLKDPDGVYESVREAASEQLSALEGLSDEELDDLKKSREEEINEDIKQWVEYGEYLTVEIDTDAGTATVTPT
jgi:hypothetical protein